MIFAPELEKKRVALRARGVKDPMNFFDQYRSDVPWISAQLKEASIPFSVIPPNITECGPIVLSIAPAEEQDPELAAWLARAPTVLVNLGSSVFYDEDMARIMATSFLPVLEQTNIQFLWKIRNMANGGEVEVSAEALAPIQEYIQSGRVRIEKWLKADPSALLDTGNIVASVHHGGANCFYEAIR